MIGLDTNLIVRHLVQDDSAQSARASEFIENRLSASNPGYVSAVVAAETAWVLERAYRFSDADIARAIEGLLAAGSLVVEHENEVFAALTMLRSGRGSFADALIGALAGKAGCSRTVTFDARAAQLPGFALL